MLGISNQQHLPSFSELSSILFNNSNNHCLKTDFNYIKNKQFPRLTTQTKHVVCSATSPLTNHPISSNNQNGKHAKIAPQHQKRINLYPRAVVCLKKQECFKMFLSGRFLTLILAIVVPCGTTSSSRNPFSRTGISSRFEVVTSYPDLTGIKIPLLSSAILCGLLIKCSLIFLKFIISI